MTFHVRMDGGGFPFPPPPNLRQRLTQFDWITSREIPITETVLINGQNGISYYVEEEFSSVEMVSATDSINIKEKENDSQ